MSYYVYIAVDRVLAKSWCISIYPDMTRMDRRLSFFLFNHTRIVTAYLDLWTQELCGFLPLYHFLLCALTVVAVTIVEYFSTKEEWGDLPAPLLRPTSPTIRILSGAPWLPTFTHRSCDWARPGSLGHRKDGGRWYLDD